MTINLPAPQARYVLETMAARNEALAEQHEQATKVFWRHKSHKDCATIHPGRLEHWAKRIVDIEAERLNIIAIRAEILDAIENGDIR